MSRFSLNDHVFSVGASDPNLPYFDCLMPTPYGTTYNSYVVRGSEKTALIDPVQTDCADQLFSHLSEAGITHLDYMIVLHTEQDHSGSANLVRERFPGVQLVATAKVAEFMRYHLHIPEEEFMILGKGDCLDLGDVTLECIPIPFAHWPDNTMFWMTEDGYLFSSDLFGSHYAAPSWKTDESVQLMEARAYFSEIMMPGAMQVARHTASVRQLNPSVICPAHGPVWKNPEKILALYERMMSDKVRRNVVIAGLSMHGSTAEMIRIAAETLTSEGIDVDVRDLCDANHDLRVTLGAAVTACVNSAAFIMASPTVLGGPHPLSASMALLLNAFGPKLRFFGLMGSFGWGTQIGKVCESLLPRLKAERLEPLLIRGLPTKEDEEAVRQWAKALADKINAIPESEII